MAPEKLDDLSRAELIDVVGQLSRRVESLEHERAKLIRLMFAPKTERRVLTPIDARQGTLFGEEVAALEQSLEKRDDTPPPAKRRAKAKRRSAFPKNIPREVQVFDLSEAERGCSCGQTLVDMEADIVTEILERVDTSLVREIRRKKYCCRGCQSGVTVAPGPTRVAPKSVLGDSFLSHLLVERYQHHMPFHRQETKYASEGLPVSRSVLSDATKRCADLLEPVFRVHEEEVFATDYLKVDETHVRLKGAHGGETAQFWGYLSPQKGVVFDFQTTRSKEGIHEKLRCHRGFLQIDGYAAYDHVCELPEVTRVGCWAHVRRKFVEAESADPEFAEEAIRLIGRIYDVDRHARDKPPDVRHEFRAEFGPPVLKHFEEWLELRQTQVLHKSPLDAAIRYARGQWSALTTFLEDGRIDLDNNTIEQQLRHVAVGRKNWTHLANRNGGTRAALFYSLIQTCKLLGLNPREYLHDVLVRRARGDDPAGLTPARWKEQRNAESAITR